jgi:hypothetical protein
MKKSWINSAALFGAGLIAGAAAIGVGQDSKPASAPTPEEMMKMMAEMPPEQMMQAYMEKIGSLVAANKGQYDALRHCVGEWKVTQNHHMGENVMESKGTESCAMLGDYWLVSEYTGDVMGSPFEGRLIAGFDPVAGKAVGVWIDTMAPTMMVFEGEHDLATREAVLHSTMLDPMTGAPTTYVLRDKWVDDNTRDWSMGMVMGEDEMPMMTSRYERVVK